MWRAATLPPAVPLPLLTPWPPGEPSEVTHVKHRYVPWALLLAVAGTGAVGADQKPNAVIARYRAALARTRTMTADIQLKMGASGQAEAVSIRARLMKPDLADLTMTQGGHEVQRFVGNGKGGLVLMASQKQFMKAPGGLNKGMLTQLAGLPTAAFLHPEMLKEWTFSGASRETKDGVAYTVLNVRTAVELPMSGKAYFNAAGLMVGTELTAKLGDQTFSQSCWLKNLKLNAPLRARQFALAPPAGYTKFDPSSDYEKTLLAVGKDAPDFLLPQPGGNQLSLSDSLKGQKAVLVNFWFYG